MRRTILCGVLVLAGCGPPAVEDEAGPSGPPAAERGGTREAPKGGPGAPARVGGDPPDATRPPGAEVTVAPAYSPREEDRATLVANGTPGFARAALFDELGQDPEADDRDRLGAAIGRGELVDLEGNVPVLVLRNLDPAGAREPGRHYAVEVEILDGPRKGERWFVDESTVVRLVPKVVHPPLAPGSYATVAGPEAIAYEGWEALDPAARPPGRAAKAEAFRIGKGARVVVLEGRAEGLRVRVDSGSDLVGREGVVARSDLRPMVPPSGPATPGR